MPVDVPVAPSSWLLHYYLLVFIASIGVYQAASTIAGLSGIGFLPYRRLRLLLGVMIIAGAFLWFFLSEPNRNHLQHYVEGAQQLGFFLLGIVTAYIANCVLASLIQIGATLAARRPSGPRQWDQGMETLKHSTLIGGIIGSIRNMRGGDE